MEIQIRFRFQDFRKLGLLINMQFALSYETLKTIENWTAFGPKSGERKLTFISWPARKSIGKAQKLSIALQLHWLKLQFIRTSNCTSRAFVSPGRRYGISPANVIRARAWCRRISRYCKKTRTKTKNKQTKKYQNKTKRVSEWKCVRRRDLQ